MRASDAVAARTESYSRESRQKVRSELAQCVREGEFPVGWPLKQPMALYEEGIAAFYYFLLMGCVIWAPIVVSILVFRALFPIFHPIRLCLIVGVVVVGIYSPTPRWRGALHSSIACTMMKYLSYTVIWYEHGDMM